MSIAVLARKTKEIKGKKPCPGVLNMTGRGGGIGRFHYAGKSQSTARNSCLVKCSNQQHSSCNGLSCSDSKPAPQMSYHNYINKKSNIADRRAGEKASIDINPFCYDNPLSRQQSTYNSSDIIQFRKQAALLSEIAKEGSNKEAFNNKCRLSNACSPGLCSYSKALKIKPSVSYTRINSSKCNFTKDIKAKNTCDNVLERRKALAFRPKNSIKYNLKFAGKSVGSFKDCDTVGNSNGWSKSEITRCKSSLLNFYYPRPFRSMQSISCGTPSDKTPCLVGGGVAIS